MTNFPARFARSRWSSTLLLFVAAMATLAFVFNRETPAESDGPKATDRFVARTIASMLRTDHLSKHRLDDTNSERAFETYLRMLDPLKLYFLQSDVGKLKRHIRDLDDFVKEGDMAFAHDVFQLYLKRMDARVAEVEKLVNMEHDFTLDEDLLIDPDVVDYATDEEAARDRWRKRIKYELLVMRSNDEEEEEAKKRIVRRYDNFAKRRHQTDSNELLEMFLTAMTTSMDPHTQYMSPSTLEDFHISMKLNLEGIGAALQITDGYTVVTQIIPGGAADKAGELKPEDRIVSVGQDAEGEMEDVVDMKLRDVVKKIRGKAGTIVRLGVIPAGTTERKIYQITRARIELKDKEARGRIIEQEDAQGQVRRIGVIDLPSFYLDMTKAKRDWENRKSSTRDVSRILSEFRAKGAEALILDLRNNGGGSLPEAIELTGLFIDQGPVVQVKDSDDQIQPYEDRSPGMGWAGPLVVVTNKFSASASEILAGAIQDYRRGLVVGDETTHGKGTVQSLTDVGARLFRLFRGRPLGALKVTMQQFYRPSGASTQKKGVQADIALPSITSQMDVGEADLDYAIDWDSIKAASYDTYDLVNRAIVQELRNRSKTRLDGSADFNKLLRDIRRYREQKEKTKVTLNEREFLAERKELDAEKEEEKEEEKDDEAEDEIFALDNFYNEELVRITLDYLDVLQQDNVAQVSPSGQPRGS